MMYIFLLLLLPLSALSAPPVPTRPNNGLTKREFSLPTESTNRILLLKPKASTKLEDVDRVARGLGLQKGNHPKKLLWRQFVIPPGKSKADTVTALKQSGLFEHITEPKIYKTQETIPNDPMFPQLWGLTNIMAPTAWDRIRETPDVVVAVVDTGIDFSHPDLVENLWTGPQGEHGYVATNGVVLPGGIDDHGHGTHVAGTIGAVGNNGVGVVGLAWKTKIMAMKVLHHGSGSSVDIVNGYEKLVELKESGVPVLVSNHSYGGSGSDPFMEDGFKLLADADIFAAVAAGNSNTDIDQRPFHPASFPFNNMVVATASDIAGEKAGFSSFGILGTDIAAPGVSILSTTRSNTYSLFSGTSMAAPHVAGLATLLRQQAPHLSASRIRDVILHPASYDVSPEFYQNNTSAKINVAKALDNLDVPSNNIPVITSVSPYTLITNSDYYPFSATAIDLDGDPLRWAGFQVNQDFANYIPGLMKKNGFMLNTTNGTIVLSGNPFAYQFASYLNIGVSDNRGGAAITNTGFEIKLDRSLRRPIPVKTWMAWTNSGTNSISFIFDVDDTNKTDYSCILELINSNGGWQGYFGYTPNPATSTIAPGFDLRITAMKLFVMDKFFNYANQSQSFNEHFPCATIGHTTNEGNVPFDVDFSFTPTVTNGTCWALLLDAISGSILPHDGEKIRFETPGMMLVRALTYNRGVTYPGGMDWIIVPVFASRFLVGETNTPPPRTVNVTVLKATQVTGPWSFFTNFTDAVKQGEEFYRLEITP